MCKVEYEKLTKPPENENMTEIIETESVQDKLASDDDFLLYESPKKKTKLDSQKHLNFLS